MTAIPSDSATRQGSESTHSATQSVTPELPKPTTYPTRRAEFISGVRDTIPLIVGAIPFGLIFGTLAVTKGLSVGATIGMSALVFAGSSQFIAAGLVGQGVSVAIIIITTFVVNLRHALYSATLAPHLKNLGQRWLFPLAFWLTDETFAVTILRYNKDQSPNKHWYQLGSSVSMYINWNFWTIVGLLLGSRVDPVAAQSWGLDYAMVVTFIGLVVPSIRNRPGLLCVLVAGVTSVVTYPMPNKLGLMVSAILGIAAGVIAEANLAKTAIDKDLSKHVPTEVPHDASQSATPVQEGNAQ